MEMKHLKILLCSHTHTEKIELTKEKMPNNEIVFF
jgi:hypothetical protein